MIVFDGPNSTIDITNETDVDVQELYSRWKDWVLISDNSKFLPAFRTFGGDPTVTGQFAPRYYFMTNGWRCVIDNEDVVFSTNLYTEEGDSAVLTVNGATASIRNSDAPIVSTTGGSGASASELTAALKPLLEVINEGVKDASLLVPHNEDLP